MRRRLLAITQSAIDPATRFRVLQYFPYLRQAGWDIDHAPAFPSVYHRYRFAAGPLHRIEHRLICSLRRLWCLARFRSAGNYDAVLVSRELPCLHRELIRRSRRLIVDFDDAIYLGPKRASIAELCAHASEVVVGNEVLAREARQWSARVHTIPTCIDASLYELSEHAPAPGPARLGWLGSSLSLAATLGPSMEMLAGCQESLGFEFIIISDRRETIPRSRLRYRFLEWSPELQCEIARHFDIGVMPLEDDPFQRAKCGLKLLQYMAAGLPVVASPVGANDRIVTPGCGYLVNGAEGWMGAIRALIGDGAARQRMGRAGRARVIEQYSLDTWASRWIELLDATVPEERGSRS